MSDVTRSGCKKRSSTRCLLICCRSRSNTAVMSLLRRDAWSDARFLPLHRAIVACHSLTLVVCTGLVLFSLQSLPVNERCTNDGKKRLLFSEPLSHQFYATSNFANVEKALGLDEVTDISAFMRK